MELLVVVAIMTVLLGAVTFVITKAKRKAEAVAAGAVIKQKIDDTVIRGAIRSHKEHDFYLKRLQEQMKTLK